MTPVEFESLEGAVGADLGRSGWTDIDQDRIDAFARATGDHQWIHVDPDAARQGPFGTTVAHGYLTLSLVPALMRELWSVSGLRMAVNYGVDRCRFPSPVPAGSRIRAHARVHSVDPESDGSKRVVLHVELEREGSDKPVCAARVVSRYYRADATT